jgi:hypothetical protein
MTMSARIPSLAIVALNFYITLVMHAAQLRFSRFTLLVQVIGRFERRWRAEGGLQVFRADVIGIRRLRGRVDGKG